MAGMLISKRGWDGCRGYGGGNLGRRRRRGGRDGRMERGDIREVMRC